MPMIGWGEELPKTGSKFIRLKNVGEKIQFRILGMAFVEGNHFFFKDGKYDIQPCPRINRQAHCDHCDRLFKALKTIPRIEDKAEYNKAVEEVKKTVPGCDPGIAYKFPIINRDTHQYGILQVTTGVRNKIEAEHSLGINVMGVDFRLVNTGKKGKDMYGFTRVDSADTQPLNDEEMAIKEAFDPKAFEEDMNGSADDESAVAIEANTEVIKDDVVNF